mmetsp:Transcript_44001/g.113748  ORF Transcript_44001/g.113748 Transcript_44001/m.113748 type:complete len:228 (-) Transcript_44001:1339-2022(-)
MVRQLVPQLLKELRSDEESLRQEVVSIDLRELVVETPIALSRLLMKRGADEILRTKCIPCALGLGDQPLNHLAVRVEEVLVAHIERRGCARGGYRRVCRACSRRLGPDDEHGVECPHIRAEVLLDLEAQAPLVDMPWNLQLEAVAHAEVGHPEAQRHHHDVDQERHDNVPRERRELTTDPEPVALHVRPSSPHGSVRASVHIDNRPLRRSCAQQLLIRQVCRDCLVN